MTEPTNSELVARVQQGDRAATAELFTRFWRAAIGGVLNKWAGQPPGIDTAHMRIFPERWTG